MTTLFEQAKQILESQQAFENIVLKDNKLFCKSPGVELVFELNNIGDVVFSYTNEEENRFLYFTYNLWDCEGDVEDWLECVSHNIYDALYTKETDE